MPYSNVKHDVEGLAGCQAAVFAWYWMQSHFEGGLCYWQHASHNMHALAPVDKCKEHVCWLIELVSMHALQLPC